MRVRIAKAVTVARNTIDAPPARSTRESTYYTNYLDTLDELSADGRVKLVRLEVKAKQEIVRIWSKTRSTWWW
ncbi:uncharacterized protein N7443_001577 [Penicillium atrosanguineum]|uniref:Uncharacterized protein n=1 Tax=Penicillium atrosanguineum TaxID=1132637 RepID=A0A9W9UD97_9EURO|nr:uncharacterized protein N7443_001577 [Penicillium atrosanguineum]KAJ5146820.1 hypothetical protein N7526_000172 [Penicillium atrosanguineum]KAJ5314693.1 hypothetical protein N7443_001577 [Penicillium atrosanguineum]KAJ5331863.1 hypothetical protein N7476_001646 [Penicillium atrosanguineum]